MSLAHDRNSIEHNPIRIDQMDIAAPTKRRALAECNQKDALLYVLTQERRRMKTELARAEERARIGVTHPMTRESWVYPGNLQYECALDDAALDAIPDRADATALVMIGPWDVGIMTQSDVDRLEPELENLVAPMGPGAVWSPARPGMASAAIEVPCSVVRRFLQTNNVWWHLPGWRDYKEAQLRVVLSDRDDHDQPIDVHDFSVYIYHRHRPKWVFDSSSHRCPQCGKW